jgi:hypothetical protein
VNWLLSSLLVEERVMQSALKPTACTAHAFRGMRRQQIKDTRTIGVD